GMRSYRRLSWTSIWDQAFLTRLRRRTSPLYVTMTYRSRSTTTPMTTHSTMGPSYGARPPSAGLLRLWVLRRPGVQDDLAQCVAALDLGVGFSQRRRSDGGERLGGGRAEASVVDEA